MPERVRLKDDEEADAPKTKAPLPLLEETKDEPAKREAKRASILAEPEDDDEEEAEPEVKDYYKREVVGPRVGDPEVAPPPANEVIDKLENDNTVPMMFPKNVSVQHDGLMHHFKQGIHDVPVSLSTHWYLKACGVKKYRK